MTTAPARRAAPSDPAAVARYLDAVAAALAGHGIGCRITSPAGTPVLITGPPSGPDAATVAIDPDPHAGPGIRLDCTCVWTPAPDAAPRATAAAIAAVLHVASPAAAARSGRQPPAADAARLAGFLLGHPGWSAFWDKRYGLWRVAEDDPGSALYAESPDPDAVITYINTRC